MSRAVTLLCAILVVCTCGIVLARSTNGTAHGNADEKSDKKSDVEAAKLEELKTKIQKVFSDFCKEQVFASLVKGEPKVRLARMTSVDEAKVTIETKMDGVPAWGLIERTIVCSFQLRNYNGCWTVIRSDATVTAEALPDLVLKIDEALAW